MRLVNAQLIVNGRKSFRPAQKTGTFYDESKT